mmetsp:Transcript_24710/g.49149  ORF Transcript_24710/g.49149 Transcript_24710/m.49149 type:complete len:304 (+) Transcript_24710:90-1001(+)
MIMAMAPPHRRPRLLLLAYVFFQVTVGKCALAFSSPSPEFSSQSAPAHSIAVGKNISFFCGNSQKTFLGNHRCRLDAVAVKKEERPADVSPTPASSQAPGPTFIIREAFYSDLPFAAHILVDGFYTRSILNHAHRLGELSRLQNNFPYSHPNHKMFVAIDPNDKGRIIGFCDVDARPPRIKPAAPRPYLSDLAVRSDWKRRGVATALVRRCEECAGVWDMKNLYLRVESSNTRALDMYEGFGYVVEPHPEFGKGRDHTILLRRDFGPEDKGGGEPPPPLKEFAAAIEGRKAGAGVWQIAGIGI